MTQSGNFSIHTRIYLNINAIIRDWIVLVHSRTS